MLVDDLKELAQEGANFNTSNHKGITPLMNACMSDDLDVISFLIKYTDKINQEDMLTYSALYYATKSQNLEAIKLLLKAGASVKDDIYMLSINYNMKEITKYFDTFKKSR